MKIALITDTHFGARADSIVFHKYFRKFYNNIFFPYLKEYDIKTVIHLGDIVDRRKFINFVTLNSFKEMFVHPLITNNINIHFIIGNHDVPYNNSNDINSISELFGENFSGINHYSKSTTIEIDGVKIALQPWINSSNYEESMEFIRNTPAQILFGHLAVNGFSMYKGGMRSEGGTEPSLFSNLDVVASGHYHHKSTIDNIHYLGTPYQLNWNDYDDERGFHIFDTTTREFEFIENPHKMFKKWFYDDDPEFYTFEQVTGQDFSSFEDCYIKVIVQHKSNPYIFDIVMDKIYNSGPVNVSIVEDNKNMDVLSDKDIIDEAEDTPTILNKYIDNMNTDVDRSSLKRLFMELLTEAMQVEGN